MRGFQLGDLRFEVQDALLASRIRGCCGRQPRLDVLGKFTSHLLGRLLLLKVGALLSGEVARQAIQVHIAGFQLLYELSHEDSRADVVEGQDEDIAAIGNPSESVVVQSLIEELRQGYIHSLDVLVLAEFAGANCGGEV